MGVASNGRRTGTYEKNNSQNVDYTFNPPETLTKNPKCPPDGWSWRASPLEAYQAGDVRAQEPHWTSCLSQLDHGLSTMLVCRPNTTNRLPPQLFSLSSRTLFCGVKVLSKYCLEPLRRTHPPLSGSTKMVHGRLTN